MLIFSMRLGGRKNTRFVNSRGLILHLQFKGKVLLLLERNNKGEKANQDRAIKLRRN